MIKRLQDFIETQFSIPHDELGLYFQRGAVVFAGIMFVLVATLIVAFDSIFLRFNSASGLEVGQIADRNIVAPANGGSYVSNVLTDIRRAEAQANVQAIYSAPEPDIARIWGERAEQTLDFIKDIRATSRYASEDQQLTDLEQMEYLIFSNPDHAIQILNLDEDTWNGIVAEVDRVLASVYRNRIIDEQVYINNQLVVQISSTFDNRTSDLIFDIVSSSLANFAFRTLSFCSICLCLLSIRLSICLIWLLRPSFLAVSVPEGLFKAPLTTSSKLSTKPLFFPFSIV